MGMLIDTPPDKIEQLDSGQYRFTFAAGRDINTLPIDAEYWIVYSPNIYKDKWHVIVFRILPGKRKARYVGIVYERKLNPAEVAHFEKLIARQEGRV